ncbi:hypothetical protein DHX103_10945 [Planococcus sp. X10-3]|uniref:hypothetical protein n=1 Tax=Planococcus sp. X10-3 TaxID=3061240 RepID=UPI003BB0CE53
MKRILMTVLILFIVMLGLLTLRFGPALTQEGNPLPILSSIIGLELSDSDYEQFAEGETQNRYVSKNTGDSRYAVIEEFMKEQGWNFVEQLGAGLVFENAEETLVIETRQFSEHYVLWDVPGELFN